MTQMTPKEIVSELNQFIVGQEPAKKAVAIALRSRWRRMQLDETLRQEVSPKNILMIGPTGVGKTEIARRIAKLAQAPFIKVEATKFTEVGYVGKEVDSIIRELADVSLKMVRQAEIDSIKPKALAIAEERILDALLPPVSGEWASKDWSGKGERAEGAAEEPASGIRELFRRKLRDGSLDSREIEIALPVYPIGVEIIAPPGMEEVTHQLQYLVQNVSGRRHRKRKMTVSEAVRYLTEEEASKLINPEELKQKAIDLVEQNAIVFIDEIDKLTQTGHRSSGSEISREGVQRDLLPLIEGCTVATKYGMVKTDHILFIASGAFQVSRPSDLIPELQGRLPVRVELKALTTEDFERILTEPSFAITKQYEALLATESIQVSFTSEGIRRIAEVAWQVNDQSENIGARRLHTIFEKLMEEISYEAEDLKGTQLCVDAAYVNKHLEGLANDEDLARFIL